MRALIGRSSSCESAPQKTSKRPIFAAAILAGILTTGTFARASDPVGFKVDIASGVADPWPADGDLDFNDRGVSTAIADLDPGSIPDVVVVSPAGGGAQLTSRNGWDGTIKGKTTLAYGKYVATGTFSDGTHQELDAVVGPGPGDPGNIQMFHWDTNSSQFVAAKAGGGVFPSPFGSNYIIGSGCVPCDLDGDGYDSLVCVAQGAVPPVNNAPGSRVVVMSQPKGGGAFTRAFTVDVKGPDATTPINVACGPLLGDGTSQIAAVYPDPATGVPQLEVFRNSISVIMQNDVGQEASSLSLNFLEPVKVLHRDLACRMCMADLNGDGTDEIVVSGNNGIEPVVSILHLGTFTASDGSTGLDVTSETPVDLSALAPLYGDDWSSVEFNPSATGVLFPAIDPLAAVASPLAVPSDSGTLFLTATLVPEPTSLALVSLTLLSLTRRRRSSLSQ